MILPALDVLAEGVLCTLPAGQTLLRAGERSEQVLVLLEGRAEEVGPEWVRVIDTPGSVLGPTDWAGTTRQAVCTVRAVTDVVLMAVPARAIRAGRLR